MRNRIYRFFFNTDISMRRYILRSWVVSFVPSMVIAALLVATGLMTEETAPDLDVGGPVAIFLGVVILSPLAETFLMSFLLWVLSFITTRPLRLAFMSAIIWAILHSLAAPAWGLGVIWPFFVFSCAYLAWRKRAWWRAIWVTTCIHMLQNLVPGLLVILGGEG